MRIILLIIMLFSVTVIKAQTVLPLSPLHYTAMENFGANMHLDDSLSKKKWSFNRYGGISTSFSFFKGGNASTIAAPMILQLNRRLNDNLYAFANVAVAPSYTNFNSSFLSTNFNNANQHNGLYQSNSFGINSAASMGVMYVNDAKTFSISGSISVERSSYPVVPYYMVNNPKPAPAIPAKR